MAARRPVWVRVAVWAGVVDGLLFVPWVVAQVLGAAWGSAGGNIYFGGHPEYVFNGETVAEVGGRETWWVPVDGMAGFGLVLPITALLLVGGAALSRASERAQIRSCPEQKWLNRLAAGVCPQCGYDLRATAEKGGVLMARCPECGCRVREEAGVREAVVGAKWAKLGELREGWLTVRFVERVGAGE